MMFPFEPLAALNGYILHKNNNQQTEAWEQGKDRRSPEQRHPSGYDTGTEATDIPKGGSVPALQPDTGSGVRITYQGVPLREVDGANEEIPQSFLRKIISRRGVLGQSTLPTGKFDTMFTKSLDEITFEDVETFCQELPEGVRVEYKQEIKDVPKIVSSFANTLGGIYIIGAIADKKR